jgi:hypothetical protein
MAENIRKTCKQCKNSFYTRRQAASFCSRECYLITVKPSSSHEIYWMFISMVNRILNALIIVAIGIAIAKCIQG